MTQAAYFNVHGAPLSLSAKDAVMAREPLAYSEVESVLTVDGEALRWRIKRSSPSGRRRWSNAVIGAGVNEESAWREALSRMRLADEAEAAKA